MTAYRESPEPPDDDEDKPLVFLDAAERELWTAFFRDVAIETDADGEDSAWWADYLILARRERSENLELDDLVERQRARDDRK